MRASGAGLFTVAAMLLVVAMTVPIAQSQSGVSYNSFRVATFAPLVSQIAHQLTPCGCSSSDVLPTLTVYGVTKPTLTRWMLNVASAQLYDYMRTLMQACSCDAGINTVTAALSSTLFSSVNSTATPEDVAAFSSAISRTIETLLSECCSPQGDTTRQYEYISGAFTYSEALADAAARGGTLATVSTRSDCMRIADVLRASQAQSQLVQTPEGNIMFAWIGLERQGTWRWTSNATLTFTNWGSQQPLASYDCGAYAISDVLSVFSTWAALPCATVRIPYVLETAYTGHMPTTNPTRARDATATTVTIAIAVLAVFFVGGAVVVLWKRFGPLGSSLIAHRANTGELNRRREARGRLREVAESGTDLFEPGVGSTTIGPPQVGPTRRWLYAEDEEDLRQGPSYASERTGTEPQRQCITHRRTEGYFAAPTARPRGTRETVAPTGSTLAPKHEDDRHPGVAAARSDPVWRLVQRDAVAPFTPVNEEQSHQTRRPSNEFAPQMMTFLNPSASDTVCEKKQ